MQNTANSNQPADENHRSALIILTMLFFMWGLLTALNNVLIPHLKAIYTLTYVQAMLVQFCFFGAYFIVSVPAGVLVKKIGYQYGVVVGLLIASVGCALFYPATFTNYVVFLLAFFVLAAGIAILQVAANPYVVELGKPETAASRLTLAQAFNSLGAFIAPAIGSMLILSMPIISHAEYWSLTRPDQIAYRAKEVATVQGPYLGLAAVLLVMAVLFFFAKLPAISHPGKARGSFDVGASLRQTSVLEYRQLVIGAVAIFLYVGSEVSIGSFMISFLGMSHAAGLTPAGAAYYVSCYWGGAMVGRFIGCAVMRYVSPGKVLAFNAAGAVLCILMAMFGHGALAMWSMIAVGFFNSIMFPTIFSMAVHKLGRVTARGSGILCMAIVGGAVIPFLQGLLADNIGLLNSFFLPVLCYTFIFIFGVRYAGIYRAP